VPSCGRGVRYDVYPRKLAGLARLGNRKLGFGPREGADSGGHLLEEANASTGAPIREYVWIDDLPLALIDDTGSTPVIYYIHTDQVGSPQKITDGSGALVWDGVFDPFGNQTPTTVPTTTPTNWGAALWGSFTWAGIPLSTNPLRFPGQYYDAETQIAQNWARDYDPSLGRYIQSDPLGLQAGTTTYDYVDGNPLSYVDIEGLLKASPRVPPGGMNFTPAMQSALMCFEGKTGLSLVVTSGRRDQPGTGHGRGEACDFGRAANPRLTRSTAMEAFYQCFPNGHGQ
jgi:RHS repeat-associated protein